jgi:hypothetical protein
MGQTGSYSLAVGVRGTNVSLGGCFRRAGGQKTARSFKIYTRCLNQAARVEGQLGQLVNDRHDCLLQAIMAGERWSGGVLRKPGRREHGE